MLVSFLSFDQENNKIAYQSEAELEDNTYRFMDKSMPNTEIELVKGKDFITLKRSGYCTMCLKFLLNECTKGFYKNKDGLEFEFSVQTTELKIENSRIRISYSINIDGEPITYQRIQLSFFRKEWLKFQENTW